MSLEELARLQKEFDAGHESRFPWDQELSEQTIPLLGFTMLALSGEVGEASNLVKKIWRGDYTLEEKKPELVEELADILTYLLKLSNELHFDLEAAYLEKREKNTERFANYAKLEF